MIDKNQNSQISFIKFLWREFMPDGVSLVGQSESLATIQDNQPLTKDNDIEFKWFSAIESRELSKVLAVKLPEDSSDFSNSGQDDKEEQQINDWQKIITDNREKIINEQLPEKKVSQNTYAKAIENFSATIKGIKERRQEKKWHRQSDLNSMFAYFTGGALVMAILLTMLLPQVASYLASTNDRIDASIMPTAKSSSDRINLPMPILKFNQAQLAEYIRTNAFKFPVNHFNGQTTIVLSGQDILGLPAGASELAMPVTQAQKENKWLAAIQDLAVDLIKTGKSWTEMVYKTINN